MIIIKHKHHIIPKHAGGTDDPSNLIEVTPQEHALMHYNLWKIYDSWPDEIAYKALSGYIGKEDIIKRKMSEGARKGGKMGKGKPKPKSDIWKQKVSEYNKKNGVRPPSRKGTKWYFNGTKRVYYQSNEGLNSINNKKILKKEQKNAFMGEY